MNKVKIKLVSIGHLPLEFRSQKVEKWKSDTFEIIGGIENFALTCNSDGHNWDFTDANVKKQLPIDFEADILIALVNVPIEHNWYTRRLGDNQVVFSFHQVREFLLEKDIPLENVILRILYSHTLIFRRSGNKIPPYPETPRYTHDETRGCIFDMNGIKRNIVASSHNPKLCDDCKQQLRKERVSNSIIDSIDDDLKKIQKDLYFRLLDYVKCYPVWTLVISSVFALSLGITGSLIASYIYDNLINSPQETQDITSNSTGTKN